MTDDLARWLDDEEPESRPRPSRRAWGIALAVLPWVVVLGLVISGWGAGERLDDPVERPAGLGGDDTEAADHRRDAPAPGPAAAPAPPEHETSPGVGPGATESSAPAGPSGATSGRAIDERAAAALAVVVARGWLTDVGPTLEVADVPRTDDHYLEQATVERVEAHGSTAVVTLLAVVLRRDGDRYHDVAAHRIAVPVAIGPDGPRPAGAPWWLPDPVLTRSAPGDREPASTETALAVAEALSAAGLDAEVHAVERTGDWLVAEISAGLADGRRVEGPVWLRDDSHGPRLAGVPTSSATTPPSTGTGAPDPTTDVAGDDPARAPTEGPAQAPTDEPAPSPPPDDPDANATTDDHRDPRPQEAP